MNDNDDDEVLLLQDSEEGEFNECCRGENLIISNNNQPITAESNG